MAVGRQKQATTPLFILSKELLAFTMNLPPNTLLIIGLKKVLTQPK